MTFTAGIEIYAAIGLVFALYSDYTVRKTANSPLATLLPQPTVVDRLFNAFLMVIGWPIALLKR